jgi:hypothetical protein
MIMTESLLAICDSFSRLPYASVPKSMVRYKQLTIDRFISRFKKGKISIWKTSGLPKMSVLKHNCELTRGEAKVIYDGLTDCCNYIGNMLEEIIDFYELNRVLYGKLKHGLLFIAGLSLSRQGVLDSPSSVFIAFDKLEKEPPKICFQGKDISPKGLDWFNTYSILPYWSQTLNKYVAMLSKIVKFSEYVLWNHLFNAFNCGQDYIPMKVLSDGTARTEIYLSKKRPGEEIKRIQILIEKISKNTYFPPDVDAKVQFNFSDEKFRKLASCLKENQVATIYKQIR